MLALEQFVLPCQKISDFLAGVVGRHVYWILPGAMAINSFNYNFQCQKVISITIKSSPYNPKSKYDCATKDGPFFLPRYF